MGQTRSHFPQETHLSFYTFIRTAETGLHSP